MSLFRKLIFVISAFCLLIGCQKVELDTQNSRTENGDGTTDSVPVTIDPIAGDPTPPSIDTIYIKGVAPKACSLWENHVVLFSEEDDEYCGAWFVMLLARNEFTKVCSAKNATNPSHAEMLTSSYCEENIKGWEIPSEDIAQLFNATYAIGTDGFRALNNVLSDYTPLSSSTDVRYLCEEAEKSFSLSPSTKYSAAGAVKTYNLRPVKLLYFINADEYTGEINGNDNDDDNDDDNDNDNDNDDDNDDDNGDDNGEEVNDNENGDDDNPGADSPSATSEQCFLWNGHAVVRYDETTKIALLISQEEWSGTAAKLIEKAKGYSEDGIGDWHIPTVREAEYLMNNYSINSADFDESTITGTLNWGDLAPLQDILDELGCTPIIARANKKNHRYICDDGRQTFPFVKGLNISTAGNSTTYYLRLVKEVKL